MFDGLKNRYQKQKVEVALQALQEVFPHHFAGDNMFISGRTLSFLDDPEFQKCMENHVFGAPYTGMLWRMHILVWAIEQTIGLQGDIAEFGTFRGFKFKFLLDYFSDRLSEKNIYLFDTLVGFDPNQCDGSPNVASELHKVGLYDFVNQQFSSHNNVHIVKGVAPQSLDHVDIATFSMIHVDMNSWQAEIGTLERIWDKITPGGIIVLDDYGFSQHKAQLDKEKPWFADKGCPVLELPTGQGLVIKGKGV